MPKRARTQHINQLTADVVRKSTGASASQPPICESTISQATAAMGRKGGLKGA